MLTDFFKLNPSNYKKINDQKSFLTHFINSTSLTNSLYIPSTLIGLKGNDKLKGVSFENVSFKDTKIKDFFFIDCKFKNILFLSTEFENVKFENCIFECVNFAGTKFRNVHLDPASLTLAFPKRSYSNIALHLYAQLKENFHYTRQIDFHNLSDYYFRKWRNIRNFSHIFESKTKTILRFKIALIVTFDFLYYLFAGYGIKTYRFFIFLIFAVSVATIFNYINFDNFCFTSHEKYTNSKLIQSIYFTLTVFTNLGSSYLYPQCDYGLNLVSLQSTIGLIFSSSFIAIIIRKLFR